MLSRVFYEPRTLVGAALVFILTHAATKKLLAYQKSARAVRHHPGFGYFFSILHFWGNFLPRVPYIAIGANWQLNPGYRLFSEKGSDVLSFVTLYPNVEHGYVVADPVTIKEVTTNHSRFPKPLESYKVLAFFGQNIVVTEGHEWKKHRKLAAPAFSERNNKFIWDETIRVVSEMIEHWGPDKSEIEIPNAVDTTLHITLMVISSANFGQRMAWEKDTDIPPGHSLPFFEALQVLSKDLLLKAAVPDWAYAFSSRLRLVQQSFDELQQYMREMIEERRNRRDAQDRYDLFSALLDGCEKETEKERLTDQELIGNIFMFLVAGYETAAHSLCFILGLLALEPEQQDKLYQNIMDTVPEGVLPSYEQMPSLTYPLAVLYEALRLFPAVVIIPKYAAADTVLPITKPDGTIGTLPVVAGSFVHLHTPGLHNNPRYWKNPDDFDPSRFLGEYPKDAFLPFSGGPRACIGRRFAETEIVIALTMICRKYRVELKEPQQFVGLTMMEKRKKLLASKNVITTTPVKVPLVFRRRT